MDQKPAKPEKRSNASIEPTEETGGQKASQFDSQAGRAGGEAKPFQSASGRQQDDASEQEKENGIDPSSGGDLVSGRRNAGRDDDHNRGEQK